MKRTGKIIRNKYVLTLLVFSIWMTFFDGNSFSRQLKLSHDVSMMQQTVMEKKKEIEMIKRKLKMLKDRKMLERYAREEYRFKKKNEEIFVIVEREEE